MPLQWLPLQKPRSAVSQALTPTTGGGFMERMREEEAIEAERKYNEKMMKMKHEQEMEKLKFAVGMKEDAAKGITAGQALGRAPTAETAPTTEALTKETMPEAAKAMWDFISTLEPESQKFYIKQLKQKELGTGGFMESAGKRIEMPDSVGMYGHLVDQGLIDPATDTVIEKEREFEKGTWQLVKTDKGWFSKNTATGEMKLVETIALPKEKPEIGRYQRTPEGIYDTATGSFIERFKPDDPEDEANKTIKLAHDIAIDIAKSEDVPYRDAFYDALLGFDFTEEQAKTLAKINEYPKEKKKSAFVEWFLNIGKAEVPSGYQRKGVGAGAGAKPAFNEANVTSLIDIISDDVTTAERAHLKGQGASDTDIDEAIKRKGNR